MMHWFLRTVSCERRLSWPNFNRAMMIKTRSTEQRRIQDDRSPSNSRIVFEGDRILAYNYPGVESIKVEYGAGLPLVAAGATLLRSLRVRRRRKRQRQLRQTDEIRRSQLFLPCSMPGHTIVAYRMACSILHNCVTSTAGSRFARSGGGVITNRFEFKKSESGKAKEEC